jgi:hypothetical protein
VPASLGIEQKIILVVTRPASWSATQPLVRLNITRIAEGTGRRQQGNHRGRRAGGVRV